MERLYYDTLKVSKTASAEEIKKSHRRLVMQYHPDRNPGNKNAEDMFKKVQEAYDVLSDPVKRSQYDRDGYVGRRPSYSNPAPDPPKKYKTADDFRREREEAEKKETGTFHTKTELDAVQCHFFGGDNELIGQNIMVHLLINKNGLGKTHNIKIKKRMVCLACQGYGIPASNRKMVCRHCNGTGYLFHDVQFPNMSEECEECDGTGGFDEKCSMCNGDGLAGWTIETISVDVPKNHLSGQHIIIKSRGEPGRNGGGICGNVHVAVIVQ